MSNIYLMRFLLVLVTLICLNGIGGADQSVASPKDDTKMRALPLAGQQKLDSFDEMLERRAIRVAVPYSRTLYYIDKGHEQGITALNVRDFEAFLNKKYKKQLKRRPLTVVIIPSTRETLLNSVVNGKADIAAGNLTITDKRLEQVDFVEYSTTGINEIVVTGPDAPKLNSLEELAGQTVHVRPESSYYESLLELNRQLTAKGLEPANLVLLPNALEDEDTLEMLNAGIFKIVVMDNWKAWIWSQLLPDIKLHNQLALRKNSRIGWAIRKNSAGLQRELKEFLMQGKRQSISASRYNQLLKRVKGLKNSASDKEIVKFNQTLAYFEKYGQQYRFDPLLLAAQGYQESRLEQNARSHTGAIGIMQVLPSTGKYMKISNIKVTEPNIHAGTKYLDHLMKNYFSDAVFSELDRALFAFAAYNAGPGNIAKMRKEAARRGLDPNVWFNNVENVTAERIGSETTTYVRNVYKYYVAYALVKARQKDQNEIRQQIQQGK